MLFTFCIQKLILIMKVFFLFEKFEEVYKSLTSKGVEWGKAQNIELRTLNLEHGT